MRLDGLGWQTHRNQIVTGRFAGRCVGRAAINKLPVTVDQETILIDRELAVTGQKFLPRTIAGRTRHQKAFATDRDVELASGFTERTLAEVTAYADLHRALTHFTGVRLRQKGTELICEQVFTRLVANGRCVGNVIRRRFKSALVGGQARQTDAELFHLSKFPSNLTARKFFHRPTSLSRCQRHSTRHQPS